MNELAKRLSEEILRISNENTLTKRELVDLVEDAKLEALDKILSEDDYRYVLKREGHVEKFSKDKLYYSIANADRHKMLNAADINLIVKKVEKEFGDRSIISSTTIKKSVSDDLIRAGFPEIERDYR